MRRSRSKARTILRFLPMPGGGTRASSIFFIIISLFIFTFSILNPRFSGGLQMKMTDAAAPVIAVVHAPINKVSDLVRDISGIANLQEENQRLLEENRQLREWYQAALLLKEENTELRKLTSIKLGEKHSFVSGRVIADSGNAYVKSLLVLVGRSDGVDKGQAVMSGDGVAGRIIDAGDKTARILLVSDVNSRIPVFIESSGYKAIMAGDNSEHPYILHRDDKVELKEGARVVTSGHGGLFPYGLPVGKIIFDDQGEPEVALFSDLQNMRYVRVVNSPDIATDVK